ncbi:MAG: hypothetical protein ABIR17_08780 [Pseudolysinimonas sp.]|uniref:hypothetical protein n=1 Tax=Pseudolysinimonas sp. TaxID=2680009 RepID=UPI0032639CCA
MATESDLRDLLRDPEPEPRKHSGGGAIDVDAVLRRAHSRRRPRVIAATAVGALAMVGVFTPIVLSSLPTANSTADHSALTSQEAGGAAPMAGDADQGSRAAESVALCGEPIPDSTQQNPAPNGLTLELTSVDAVAGTSAIPVTVTLHNAGQERIVGTTVATPEIAFSSDGIVLWRNPLAPANDGFAVINLEPGETYVYSTHFEAVRCTPPDDLAPLPDDLPAAGPGLFAVSAAIEFHPADGAVPIVIIGAPAVVVLRAP